MNPEEFNLPNNCARSVKELKRTGEQRGQRWAGEHSQILRRSINRHQVSALCLDSVGTTEINEG